MAMLQNNNVAKKVLWVSADSGPANHAGKLTPLSCNSLGLTNNLILPRAVLYSLLSEFT